MRNLFLLFITTVSLLTSCNNTSPKIASTKNTNKHHLNIPEKGIESLMEANAQKIIEGTDGSIIVMIGEVTRKKADITIKKDDKILDEKMVEEDENMVFDYEGNSYTLHIGNIKKPLLGEGKVNISIK